MVKHRKTHGVGVNAPQHGWAAAFERAGGVGAGCWGVGLVTLCRGQAAEHQQVVLRRVVVVRRQLRVEQIGHMQVHQLQPHQGLQAGLDLRQLRLKGRA
ncbi:hypothetical protein D3C87_1804050 [compost metagenome]